MKINIKLGDRFEISRVLQNDMHRRGKLVRAVYEVLQVYPHFVLCRKILGGYRECFGWHQMRAARRAREGRNRG